MKFFCCCEAPHVAGRSSLHQHGHGKEGMQVCPYLPEPANLSLCTQGLHSNAHKHLKAQRRAGVEPVKDHCHDIQTSEWPAAGVTNCIVCIRFMPSLIDTNVLLVHSTRCIKLYCAC